MQPHFKFGNESFCTYCGDPATDTDHIIPVAYSKSTTKRTRSDKNNFGPVTFACKSCNSICGSAFFSSFDERCRYVFTELDKQTAPVNWTMKEISKLDYSLANYVERERNRRLWMRSRTDWYQSRNYLLNLENLLWIPCLDKTTPEFDKYLYEMFEYTLTFVKTIYQ